MRISDTAAARLKELGVELRPGVPLAEKTSLGIGGTTDQLLLRDFETIPEVMRLLADEHIPHRFLGGGTNVLIADGELPWVVLHLPTSQPGMRVEGNAAYRGRCGRPGRHGHILREARSGRHGRADRSAGKRGRRAADERGRVRHADRAVRARSGAVSRGDGRRSRLCAATTFGSITVTRRLRPMT